MTWTQERAAGFEAMIEQWGVKLAVDGTEYDCIAPGQEQIKAMKQTGFDMQRPGSFSMRQSDFVASGIKERSVITYYGMKFEVYSVIDDAIDPVTDLTARLLK